MRVARGKSVCVSYERGTIIAIPPGRPPTPWRLFVIGCTCELPLQRKWHSNLTDAEACAMAVIASTPTPGAG